MEDIVVKEHHGRASRIIQKPPLAPVKHDRKSTVPIAFELQTEKRSKEREQYNNYLLQKEKTQKELQNRVSKT